MKRCPKSLKVIKSWSLEQRQASKISSDLCRILLKTLNMWGLFFEFYFLDRNH